MKFPIVCSLLLLAGLLAPLRAQEEEAAVETKLREALRNTTLQVREEQAKTAAMEASMVQSQQEAEKLKKEIPALQAQMLDERNAAANQAAELRAALEQSKERIVTLETQVAKWGKDYAAMVERARKTEAALAQAKGRIGTLERTVAEQQVKNVEMKQTADEILDRYAAHSMGATVLAREPFVSVNRAKLQTIMQDLETRIRASTITP
jgi:chromosome segregation ATPase